MHNDVVNVVVGQVQWHQHGMLMTAACVQFLFEEKTEGGNVLTTECIREMFKVYDTMAAVAVDNEESRNPLSWQRGLCDRTVLGDCKYGIASHSLNGSAFKITELNAPVCVHETTNR
jgi:hypothetical protein